MENKKRIQNDKSSVVEPDVEDRAILSQRITELEHVVADYAQRYGLTDLARKTMVNVPANAVR
ncbi:hypothetical protein [Roseovarius sp. M141]|uniref:hypothetical protein n=1 Tax=Roseovarius sp. M141 TaxID=2583806 RepID=UPI0020CB817F|nr:hypothetical protein [Roseovarius sp. M141]MCQ0090530.1 hypothetical protein [Roseovarius sp. M141]